MGREGRGGPLRARGSDVNTLLYVRKPSYTAIIVEVLEQKI